MLERYPECINPLTNIGMNEWGLDIARLDEPLRMKAMRTLTINGRTSHYTHKLSYYRGIYICMSCGLIAHVEVSQEIMAECRGHPASSYGRTNLKNIRKDPPQPPINFPEFPEVEKDSYPYNLHIHRLGVRTEMLKRRVGRIQISGSGEGGGQAGDSESD